MSKSEYNVVLGKLAPPLKDGMVMIRGGVFWPEQVLSSYCAANVKSPRIINWRDDPDYFAAERVKAKRRQRHV